MFHFRICYLSLFMVACLAAAQQQQDPGQNGTMTTGPQSVPPAICNFTSVKPTPQTKLYAHEKCTLVKFAAYLSFGEAKFIELNNGTVDSKSSRCHNETVDPRVVVTFPCGQLEFDISRSTNGSEIFIKSMSGFYKINDAEFTFKNTTSGFETFQTGHYYKCNTEQSIPIVLGTGDTNTTHLVLSNFAYEAYRTATGTDFYKVPEECALDMSQVSYTTRIGIGISVVALAIIILVAYLVGRRRWSERSSYESV